MKIAVVDYGMGNLRSVSKAIEHVAPQAEVLVTADPGRIASADKVVVPGQGAMRDCMRHLAESGAREAVIDAARQKPFLGICIGLQMLFEHGEEGDTKGLGLLPGDVPRFRVSGLKIPHMGWNELGELKPHPLLAGIAARDHAYFVHSFQLKASREETVLALTDYGGPITAVIGRDNLAGTQFHPEKSQATGLRLIANFLAWKP